MTTFTRGELARASEVNVETLRYYERRGLLRDPRGGGDGYRTYNDEDAERVRFIRAAQGCGFTLKEIARLISLLGEEETRCGDLQALVEAKISELEQKIKSLRQIQSRLAPLTGTCDWDGAVRDCPTADLTALGKTDRPDAAD